jgi:SAM-dependent methyltransferase
MTLPEFPADRSVHGIGLTDWHGYADRLAAKHSYVNTFFDREPRLDMTDIGSVSMQDADYLIASDVFEHIAPPIDRAFHNAFDLLRPGGAFIFSVPYRNDGSTEEHFPDLQDYRIVDFGDERVLVNRAVDGTLSTRRGLIFHGGEGTTLEMRLFSKLDIERHLGDAGFVDIEYVPSMPAFGIDERFSFPLMARRPAEPHVKPARIQTFE